MTSGKQLLIEMFPYFIADILQQHSYFLFHWAGICFLFFFVFFSPREVCLVTYSTRLGIKQELFGAV